MRVIKKYPNRRLYDTEKSAYITLAEVHDLIRRNEDFKVVDSETAEDITRNILVQIIIEQESGDHPIFTTDMLTKFIRFYDDAAQNLFGEFLERNLQIFTEQQRKFQKQVVEGLTHSPLPKMMQEMTERNLAMWQDMQKSFIDIATSGIRPKETSDDPADKKKKK